MVTALTEQFQAIRRLVASKAGFESFITMPGFRDRLGKRVIAALKVCVCVLCVCVCLCVCVFFPVYV